jgi:hypothetical protein
MRPYQLVSFTLDTSVDKVRTAAVQVPQWARYGMLLLPALADDDVEMQMMVDGVATSATILASNDTGWADVYDDAEGKVVAGSGTIEGAWVDCSNYIRALPKDCWIRFGTPGQDQASGPLTWQIAFRGA